MTQVLSRRQARQRFAVRFVQPDFQLRAIQALEPRRDLRRQGQNVLAHRDELTGHVLAVRLERDQLAPFFGQLQLFDVRRDAPLARLLEFEVPGPVGGGLDLGPEARRPPAVARDERIGPMARFRQPFLREVLHLALGAPEFQGYPPHVDQEIVCRRCHHQNENEMTCLDRYCRHRPGSPSPATLMCPCPLPCLRSRAR
jgi:hypothetical protein